MNETRLVSGNPYASLFWDMVQHAQKAQASDIHIQPETNGVDIRFRVHGELSRWMWIDETHRIAFLQQAKLLSNCSLAVSGRAQDARVAIPSLGLNVRVNLVPSLFGEKLVLRLLDQARSFSLESSGLDNSSIQAIQWSLSRSNGVALFTGPTGSGKSTLLYSALNNLNKSTLNIITIEDPIEYTFSGITQVQASKNLSMSEALRAMLRQDPDVILLGEIRDSETAKLCFQAASTGHLVLSTLHANSATEVEARLSSLGVQSDQIRSCLRFSSAQRLLGRLCPNCKQVDTVQRGFTRNFSGCSNCRLGLVGRVPVFEYEKLGSNKECSATLTESATRLYLSGEIDAREVAHAA